MSEISAESPISKVTHVVGVTVWFDWATIRELEKVCLFEREKRGPLLRRITVEKLQVYERNPAFKRFLKQLEQRKTT